LGGVTGGEGTGVPTYEAEIPAPLGQRV